MATNETKQATKPENSKENFEATYTIAELVDAASSFNTTRTVVRAALSMAGKKAYTKKEATKLIETMKKKEVKA